MRLLNIETGLVEGLNEPPKNLYYAISYTWPVEATNYEYRFSTSEQCGIERMSWPGTLGAHGTYDSLQQLHPAAWEPSFFSHRGGTRQVRERPPDHARRKSIPSEPRAGHHNNSSKIQQPAARLSCQIQASVETQRPDSFSSKRKSCDVSNDYEKACKLKRLSPPKAETWDRGIGIGLQSVSSFPVGSIGEILECDVRRERSEQPQPGIVLLQGSESTQKRDSVMSSYEGDSTIDPGLLVPQSSACVSRHDNTQQLALAFSPRQNITTSKRFSCAACGQPSATEKALEDHADFHDHRAFKCTEEPGCTHSCHRRALLDRHIAYHKAPKSYECEFCDDHRDMDAFKRLDAWDQHMKRKHFVEWEKQLVKHCPYADCEYAKSGFRFASRVSYRSHMANVHGEGKSDCPLGKEGKCKRVGKNGFKRARDLEEHIKNVHGSVSAQPSQSDRLEDDILPPCNIF